MKLGRQQYAGHSNPEDVAATRMEQLLSHCLLDLKEASSGFLRVLNAEQVSASCLS